jgi:hypothetical protein
MSGVGERGVPLPWAWRGTMEDGGLKHGQCPMRKAASRPLGLWVRVSHRSPLIRNEEPTTRNPSPPHQFLVPSFRY